MKFTTTTQQIKNYKAWCKKYDWEEFEIPKPLSTLVTDKNSHVVLVPYFKDCQETYNNLIQVFKDTYKEKWINDDIRSDPEHMRYIGDAPTNCVRWEVIDFNANRGDSVQEAKEKPEQLAHAGVLAMAIQDPKFFKSMDGEAVPYTNTGFEVTLPGRGAWRLCLYVYWNPGNSRAWVDAGWIGLRYRRWSAPVLREYLGLSTRKLGTLEPQNLDLGKHFETYIKQVEDISYKQGWNDAVDAITLPERKL